MNTTATRMPVSVITSLTMHAAVLGLWLYTVHQAGKHRLTVINDVSFIQVKKPLPFPKPAASIKPQKSTFDFLKMALPSIPKVAPRALNVPLPDARKPLQVQAPKLAKDRGRLDAGPKLNMDLDKNRNLDIAKVEARIPNRKITALAAMPRLEEVGRRRVADLPAAIAMEEKRQEALALRAEDALSRATTRRTGLNGIQPLREAEPASGSSSKFSQKIAAMMPSETMDMRPAVMQAPRIKQSVSAPPTQSRKSSALQNNEKKGVEIEGPLADRKVVAHEIPEFPAWAKEQGVLEANVSIRFWVNKDGGVLPNMRVEHTSGYGRLDRLSMESLAKWKFAPLIADEKQWGVITFRFLLE